MKNKTRIMSSILALITVMNMSGCSKKVKCDETTRHSHLYECTIDDDVTIKKYFNSEKVNIKEGDYEFDRTKYYSLNDTQQKAVVENDLVSINKNYDYFDYLIDNGYKDTNDLWKFYAILYDGSIICSSFETVDDAILNGFCYFKFTGNLDDIIYHTQGKSLTKTMN